MELYKVAHITPPQQGLAPQYTLFDVEAKHVIDRKFLRQDLLKIDPNIVEGLADDHYVVEKVIDKRGRGKNIKYLVSWQGWPARQHNLGQTFCFVSDAHR